MVNIGPTSRDLQFGQALEPDLEFLEIHQSIDSTNARVRAQFDGLVTKSPLPPVGLIGVVCADEQTAGRGRLQREWVSPADENIYCSFGFSMKSTLNLSGLSLVVGLSLRQVVLRQLKRFDTESSVSVKWPNDLLVDGKKAGGVLIEATQSDDRWWVIVGIGLNVNMRSLPLQLLQRPWTSLHLAAGAPMHRGEILDDLAKTLEYDVREFMTKGWIAFAERWPEADALLDQEVKVPLSDKPKDHLQGYGRGVNGIGELLVEDSRGEFHSIVSGEILMPIEF